MDTSSFVYLFSAFCFFMLRFRYIYKMFLAEHMVQVGA